MRYSGQKMISSETIQQLREETPGVKNRIHLNNAGAALMPSPVIKAIHDHIELEAQIGGYEAAAAKQNRNRGILHRACADAECPTPSNSLYGQRHRLLQPGFVFHPFSKGRYHSHYE